MNRINRMLPIAAVLALVALPGCAVQRAETAANAKAALVGMAKEDVLACMGAPNTNATQGDTEVWGYNSGDGRVSTFATANAFTTGQSSTFGRATLIGNTAYYGGQSFGSANTNAFGFGTSRRFYCTVNVVFKDGRVSRVNYAGPTGPLLAQGEQCAYAVQNCVH